MTAIEAMIYCLGDIPPDIEDGERRSRIVYDSNGDPHWFAWRMAHGGRASPRPCSESPCPFAVAMEYSTERVIAP